MDTLYDDEYFSNDDEVAFDWEDDIKKTEEDIVIEDENAFDYTEEEYKPERNINERVGLADELIGLFSNENIKTRDPLELFRRKVRAISLNIKEEFKGVISQKDINKIIINAENIKYVDFKNPYGYVLGYIASSGGNKIDKKNVEYIFNNILPFINSESENFVKQPDVIRYAKFWLLL